jgi:branched-chain amino acid transport system permease protein
MGALLVHALTGLAGASSLFLVASGLTVIFGVTRVVNFAHGSLTMLGAYLGWTVLTHLPRDPAWFVLGVLGTAAGLAALGTLLEMGLLRRLYRSPELFQLLATFGVVLIVQDAALALWGPDDLTISRPAWLRAFVRIAGERFPVYDLVLIAIGPVMLALLWLVFNRTRWGRLVRAATWDRDMVGALGVDQRMLFTSVFALGAGLAGLAGGLGLPDGSANLGIDLSVITDAFVVVVIGGLGSITGAYLASVLIGLLQAFGVVLIPKATLVLVFVVMAVVLVLRPNGLLGRGTAPTALAGAATLVRPPTRGMLLGWLLLLLAALAAPLLAGPYALSVLTEAAVAVLFAASLHFVMGPGGMASFGHAAWFGIGAYAAGLSARWLGAPMPVGLLLAPLAAGLAAALFGAFVVRLSGVYLAMLTLAFAQIVWAVAFQWVSVTGGDNGILGVWPPAWASGPAATYMLALTLCGGGAAVLQRVLQSPFGYALRASRDSPLRAEAIGLDIRRIRLAAFVAAGAAAGLSGAVFTYVKGSVFPGFVSIPRSVDALLMVLLGGVQTMAGPIVGALAYTGLHDGLLRVTEYWRLVLGAAIVLLVLAFPEGIAGAVQRWVRGRGRRA